MRDDLLVLDPVEVAWFVSALEFLEKLAIRARMALPPAVAAQKSALTQHLSRVGGRVDTTTRPITELDSHTEIDASEAAERLGISADAMRKACRSGRFGGVARKHHGRWFIPLADIEAMKGERTA
jgi:hypothetical protein